MALFLFEVLWGAAAIAVFVAVHYVYEWGSLTMPEIAIRALVFSITLAPGVVVLHDVALLPVLIAVVWQHESESVMWNALSWLVVFASCLLVGYVLRRRSSHGKAAASAP